VIIRCFEGNLQCDIHGFARWPWKKFQVWFQSVQNGDKVGAVPEVGREVAYLQIPRLFRVSSYFANPRRSRRFEAIGVSVECREVEVNGPQQSENEVLVFVDDIDRFNALEGADAVVSEVRKRN